MSGREIYGQRAEAAGCGGGGAGRQAEKDPEVDEQRWSDLHPNPPVPPPTHTH